MEASKNIQSHMNLLGLKVRDRITGYEGVLTSVAFDLYGCVTAIINPGRQKDGKLGDQLWFDIGRIEVLSKKPVMEPPNFEYGQIAEGKKGAENKPVLNKA